MTKDVGILVLGLLVAAMPFLGFPGGTERIIFVVSGLVIALLAFFIRGELGGSQEKTDSFVQNGVQNHSVDGIVARKQSEDHEAKEEKNGE